MIVMADPAETSADLDFIFSTNALEVSQCRSQGSILLFAMIFFGNLFCHKYNIITLIHFNKIRGD